MDVVVLYSEGCPNGALAERRLKVAARRLGVNIVVSCRLAGEHDPSFAGSPTLLVNGADPFEAGSDAGSATCRLYSTRLGLQGAPGVEEIEAMISTVGINARTTFTPL